MKFDFEISSVLKFRNKIAEIFHFSIKIGNSIFRMPLESQALDCPRFILKL